MHSHIKTPKCQSLGGELFEFTDFDQQYQDVFNYLKAKGGKSVIALRRAKNGNFVWPISGKEHRQRQNISWKGEPVGRGDLSEVKHVKDSFRDLKCNSWSLYLVYFWLLITLIVTDFIELLPILFVLSFNSQNFFPKRLSV